MYVVMSGEMQIVERSPVFEMVPPDVIFGEMALIGKNLRSAMATQQATRWLFPLTRFALRVMDIVSSRVPAMNNWVTSTSSPIEELRMFDYRFSNGMSLC